jgi:hypothetical protein
MHTIDDLRAELFATLKGLRDPNAPLDVARARAVVDVASVIVDTAKVEVAMLEATGSAGTGFIPDRDQKALPGAAARPALRAAGGRA